MRVVQKVLVNEAQIELAVERAVQALAPDVVRIRFSLDEDWSGDPAVFFRIIISDKAARKGRLSDIADRVMSTLRHEVKPDDLGLYAYFNYRTVAEQSGLKDPKWA